MEEKFVQIIEEVVGSPIEVASGSTPITIVLPPDQLVYYTQRLNQHKLTYFDQLSCITGLDNGPQTNTMEVIYHLYSIPFNRSLGLKVVLPRENPEVDSLTSTWKSANWLEREVFDMYGIIFRGHPDLRRILMPADWQGFPLRKDYQHEETYHGVQVKY